MNTLVLYCFVHLIQFEGTFLTSFHADAKYYGTG
jgi:hypothetical protein